MPAQTIVEKHLGVKAVPTPEAGGLNAPMTDADKVADVLVALRKENIDLDEMSVQKPTLDEVFMTITGHDTKDGKKVRKTGE